MTFTTPRTAANLINLADRAASTSVLRQAIAKFDYVLWGAYRSASLIATLQTSIAYCLLVKPAGVHANYVIGYEIGGQYGNVTGITRVGTTVTVTTDNYQSASTIGQSFGLFGDSAFIGTWVLTGSSGSVGGAGTLTFTASGPAASAPNETGIVNLVVYQMVNTANYVHVAKFFGENWQLRKTGPGGPFTSWTTQFNGQDCNLAFCPVDGSGQDWITYYITDTQNFIFANCAGLRRVFLDNYINPRLDVINGLTSQNLRDWRRDGSQQDYQASAIVNAHIAGYAGGAALCRSLSTGRTKSPDLLVTGNVDSTFTTAGWNGTIESAVLENWAAASSLNASTIVTQIAWHDTVKARLLLPREIVFLCRGSSTTNYKDFRYVFCAANMRPNGNFSYSAPEANTVYNNTTWYDEYYAQLGSPTDADPVAAWTMGLWRRVFQNGWVLANPTAGSVDIDLTAFRLRHLGQADFGGATPQDPTVNNGANVGILTLPSHDGVVLLFQ